LARYQKTRWCSVSQAFGALLGPIRTGHGGLFLGNYVPGGFTIPGKISFVNE